MSTPERPNLLLEVIAGRMTSAEYVAQLRENARAHNRLILSADYLEAALVEARTQAAHETREEIAAHIESRIAPYAGTKIPGPTYWINEKLRELAEWVRSGGPE